MKKLVLIVCAVVLTMGLAACSCGQVSSSASSAGSASSASSSATSASSASASTTTSASSSSAQTTGGPFENSASASAAPASAAPANSAPANSASAETPVDPGLPAGEFGYVAQRGGYRGSITVNGDGTATIGYAFAMKPETHTTLYEVQRTDGSSPAAGPMYSLVPISGDDTDVLSAYYDESQDAIIVNEMMYVRV